MSSTGQLPRKGSPTVSLALMVRQHLPRLKRSIDRRQDSCTYSNRCMGVVLNHRRKQGNIFRLTHRKSKMEASLLQHWPYSTWGRPPGYLRPSGPRTPRHNWGPPRGIRPSAMKRHLRGNKQSSPKPMNRIMEASQRFNKVISDHDWQRRRARWPATDILLLLVDGVNTKDAFAAQFDEITEAFRGWERVIGPLWRSPNATQGHPNPAGKHATSLNAEDDRDTSEPFDPRRQYQNQFCGANPVPNLRHLPRYRAMCPPSSAPSNGKTSNISVEVNRDRLPQGIPGRTESML